MLETPIAFIIFNRPDTTRRVFAEIAKAKPRKLLVIADGPRPDRAGEAERCDAVRSIVENVDWECEVLRNYSISNLGCKYRVSSGLNWVFENCEEAIILEDDCLPNQSFFQYSSELLSKYHANNNVMCISGSNFQFGRNRGSFSYYFSKYAHIWGWASWRRAWVLNDLELEKWETLKNTDWLNNRVASYREKNYWENTFNLCAAGRVDSWGLPWMFSCWLNDGSTVIPNVNLVSNIGFGSDAVHTKNDIYGVADMETHSMQFPLKHPSTLSINRKADNYTFNRLFSKEEYKPSMVKRIIKKLLRGDIHT